MFTFVFGLVYKKKKNPIACIFLCTASGQSTFCMKGCFTLFTLSDTNAFVHKKRGAAESFPTCLSYGYTQAEGREMIEIL